jgi:hypothetical protein
VLEALRVATVVVPVVGPALSAPLTLALFLLDLGRGQLYNALFTLLGLQGASGVFLGIALKVGRDALELVAPDVRGALRSAVYSSSKSFVVGLSVWLFTTMAPDFVREPLVALLDRLRDGADEVNAKLDRMQAAAVAALPPPLRASIRVTLPRVPSDKIPTLDTLQDAAALLHDPRLTCIPEVLRLADELRAVPPYALLLDLAAVPPPGPARDALCASVQPFAAALAPRVELVAPPAQTAARN